VLFRSIRAHGMEPRTQDVGIQHAEASGHEADRLGLVEGAPVIVLERVRTANGRPVVFTRDVMSATLFEAASVSPVELVSYSGSLYQFFVDRLERSVVDGIARISPEVAAGQLATRLKVPVGTPLLLLEQIDSDASGNHVLLSWDHYVADIFEFVIHRRGPHLPEHLPSPGTWEDASPDDRDEAPIQLPRL